jgi:enoyl-CoA hydratase/3-hydroxyacyl-CoA dehydrogenase
MTKPYSNPLLYIPSRPLPRCIAVIGAGTIGPDIGYYLKNALPGLKLYLLDVSQEAVDRAIQRFHDYAQKAVTRGAMSEAEAKAVTENLIGTLDYNVIADADWVLEAATENVEIKRKIFEQVESIVRPDTLITSNTSSLPAEQIFSDIKLKGRATVTHFFTPAWRNPVVEVIQWKHADINVVEYLRWIFCITGKVPLVTADVASFMLDRIFTNWCNEAALLLDRGSAAEIDTVAKEFVHAGPFFVLNLTRGNPIMIETNTLQASLEGKHYLPAAIFRSVETWVTSIPGKRNEVSTSTREAVRERLLGILFSQSFDILDREIGDPADLNIGSCLALGFKKGPLDLMRDLGDETSRRTLDRLSKERPGMPMPTRPLAAYQEYLHHILVDKLDGVIVITLRRPDALNALHDEMTDEILSVIRRYEASDDVRGFVIVGYGTRAFCAGADIGRFPRVLGDEEAAVKYGHDCSRLLVHLDKMTKPVVAALNGMTLGGGLELAIRCHGIVALNNAWMQLPEITLGIVPGIGALIVPYRRWPQAASVFHGMLRKADRLKALDAEELGVVDALADNYADLIKAAVARVTELQGKLTAIKDDPVAIPAFEPIEPKTHTGELLSAEVIGIMESAILAGAEAPSFTEALEIGYRAFARSACTAAAREGISAFQEKRKPDFSRTT